VYRLFVFGGARASLAPNAQQWQGRRCRWISIRCRGRWRRPSARASISRSASISQRR